MSYASAYSDAVVEYTAHSNALEERKRGLYDLVAATPPQGMVSWKSERERIQHAANAMIANDPECQDHQTRMDRAAQRAIMWGIGALLERIPSWTR